jgi:prophage regulatory protein
MRQTMVTKSSLQLSETEIVSLKTSIDDPKANSPIPVIIPDERATPQLLETRIVRLKTIIGDPKADPPIPAILPIGRTSFLNRIKDGTYSIQTIRLGPRSVAYKLQDILDLIEKLGNQ